MHGFIFAKSMQWVKNGLIVPTRGRGAKETGRINKICLVGGPARRVIPVKTGIQDSLIIIQIQYR
jgi:hypothetical protein